MRRLPTVFLPILIVPLLLAACSSSGPPPLVKSEPDSITIERGGGLGFCPAEGMLETATLERTEAGTFSMQGVVIESVPMGCYEASCVETRTLAPFELSAEQSQRVDTLVAEIPERRCDRDEGLACDPCLVESLEIDGTSVSRGCCGDLNEGFANGFDELAAFLDGLPME